MLNSNPVSTNDTEKQKSTPSRSSEESLASWLETLCSQVDAVTTGLLLVVSNQEDTFVPAAIWPKHDGDLTHLGSVARQALSERKGVVLAHAAEPPLSILAGVYVGYPLEVRGVLKAAIVLDIASRSDEQVQRALKLIHWSTAWLVNLFEQQLQYDRDQSLHRISLVNALLVSALQANDVKQCAMVVVNELTIRMNCDRTSLGLERNETTYVEAISNTANFDSKTNLVNMIADAMDEVFDADGPLSYPASGDAMLASAAQAALAEESGAVAVISLPLIHDSRNIGALTIERNSGLAFSASDLNTCKVLGEVLGPVFALKRENERGIAWRSWKALRKGLRALYEPGHPGAKLIALAICSALVFAGLATGEYRVAATTVVEGAVQRTTAAPFDGYIAETYVQPGDLVRKDQIMARLEDRDMRVELARWTAEREQYLRKYRQARANHENAAMNIFNAQADQADAQVQLIEDRLKRTQLLAPFDGVVVSGDLRQLIGTPVELGKVLFETAPLNTFRVVLQVNERHIRFLATGQRGELVLSSMPGERFSFAVTQITPVAVAQEGRNFFRVEARMEGGGERMRPGMEGIGKISVGKQRLAWIWTHSLTEWLTLFFWSWSP